MAARDISMTSEGMERLTESMLLSVIIQYMTFIFGPHAKVLNSHEFDSASIYPDFIVALPDNNFAIVEVKNQTPNTSLRLDAVANQLLSYANAFQKDNPGATVSRVLIIVGTLSIDNRSYLANRGVDRVIDTAELLHLAKDGYIPGSADSPNMTVDESPDIVIDNTSNDKVPQPAAEIFLQMLEDIQPGKSTWVRYQKLAGDILEFLFCPELAKPIPELSNQTRTNRRDFIFPNYAINGYWYSLRVHYAAHFVVVDAKNYKGKIGKTEVLQIANYLSDHGAGLFGLIISRNGSKRDAEITQREQWAIYRKMIVILDDADLKQMLAVRSSNGEPADLIRQKIEDFRLGF